MNAYQNLETLLGDRAEFLLDHTCETVPEVYLERQVTIA